ncbi:MAG: hypothetical protein K9H61_11595 [Bacteroidia bacterium]|nr:hypothetical protein [Bacteroidia bacterium]MCF8426446.1 hypothetical protein [Bacteroidia bacterium]MCF8447632.1 hypothetical protein [Bacteroidia bacterium]
MINYLLPNVFKKLGLVLIILCYIFIAFATDMGINAIERENIIILTAVLGFLLIINSKEKMEDERTMICRYKALGHTFRFVLLFLLFATIIEIFNPEIQTRQIGISFFTVSILEYYSTFEKHLKNEL